LANLQKKNAFIESKAIENLDIHPDNVLEVGFGSGVGLTNELKTGTKQWSSVPH